MKKKIFRYYKGEENIVVVEKKNYEESLFREQYAQALQLVTDIAEHPKDEVPNLVTFCGDRGEGKTSCMMTVSYIIEHGTTESIKNEMMAIGVDMEKIAHKKFEILPIIDPAFFDKEHNIIELLLGHIYKGFKDWRNNHESEGMYAATNEVSKLFQKTKECLMHIGQSKVEMYDPLEELEVLSAGVELSSCISSLMDAYLRLIGREKLLICIDDIDLNMSRAYRMCEEIRKYLNNKYCLILMSVKVDQLIDAIENSIHKDASFPDSIDFSGMASKYVDKLIPVPVRVNMPKAYDLCDYRLEVYDKRGEGAKLIYPSLSVKNGVVRKIFATSRFLFYNSKGSVSRIVPNNLRGLAQLLGLLFSMRDIDSVEDDEKTDALEINKNFFKGYLYKSWVKQLKREDQNFVADLTARQDGNDLNKYVVSYLGLWLLKLKVKDELITEITNSSNYGYNISVGDVLYLVSYLEQSSIDEELNMVLFFIKSFYSIRLFEKYDDVTNHLDSELYPEPVEGGNLYKADAMFERTNVLQRFVAGSYFSYAPNDLIAPMRIDDYSQSRDYGVVNGKSDSGLTDLLIGLSKILKGGGIDTLPEKDRSYFMLKFRMAEYFMLSINRNILGRDIREDKKEKTVSLPPLERSAANPAYLKAFNNQMGYYVFDVLAPFYAMTNPQYAYARFSDIADLYETALNNEWSLMRKMMEVVRQKEIRENESTIPEEERENYLPVKDNLEYWKWRLLSNAVIRNTEVSLAIMESCKHNRPYLRDSSVSRELLAGFYRSIVKSNMMTYNRSEEVSPYYINFDFLNPIIEMLYDGGLDEEREVGGIALPTFDQIYVYVVKEKNSKTSVKRTDMAESVFGPSLYRFTPMKGSSVINRIRKKQEDMYYMVPTRVWREWFEKEATYNKEQVLQILQQHLIEFVMKEGDSSDNLED